MKKIGKMYKTGTKIIKRLLNNYNFTIRSYEDALSLAALKGKKVPSKDELYELYVEKGKSIDEISKIYGLSHSPINRLLRIYDIKPKTLKQAAQARIRKQKKEKLEQLDDEEYKGLKGLIGLFSSAMDDEEAMETAREITYNYLDKFRNLCDTLGEDKILEELYLISKNDKNKFVSFLLYCLYKASLKTGIKPSEILDRKCEEFEILQRDFYNELRLAYIKNTVKKITAAK